MRAVEFCIPHTRVVDVATLAVISALYIHVYKGVGGGIVLVPTHRRLVLCVCSNQFTDGMQAVNQLCMCG